MPIAVTRQASSRTYNNLEMKIQVKAQSLHSTFNRLSKWIAFVIFIVVIVWRHDAKALWTAMGCVLNFILSTALKKILKQKRPSASVRSDPGMPSSHSQSIFFISIFANISVLERLGTNEYTLLICGAILAYSSYLAWLRVLTENHTISQVVAGAVVGSFFSSFWSYAWNTVVLHAFTSSLCIRVVVIVGTSGIWIWCVLVVILRRALGTSARKTYRD